MAPPNPQRRVRLFPALPYEGASNQPASNQPVPNQRSRRTGSPAVLIKKVPAPSHANTQAGTSSDNPIRISEKESISPVSDKGSDSSGETDSSDDDDGPVLRRITLLPGLPFPGEASPSRASTACASPVSTTRASQQRLSTQQAAGSSTPTATPDKPSPSSPNLFEILKARHLPQWKKSIVKSVEPPEPVTQLSNRTEHVVEPDDNEGASLQRAVSVCASPVETTEETFRLSGAPPVPLTSHDDLYADPSPSPMPRSQRQPRRLLHRPAAPSNGVAGIRQGIARAPIATKMPRQTVATKMPRQAVATKSPRKTVATKSPRKTVATKMPRKTVATKMPRTIATKMPRQPPGSQSTSATNLPPQVNVVPPQINFGSPPTPFLPPPQINVVPSPTNLAPPQVNVLPPRANLAPPQINNGLPQANFVVPQVNVVPPQAGFVPPQANSVPPQANHMPSQANLAPHQIDFGRPQPNFAPPQVNVAPTQFTNGFVTDSTTWAQMTPVQNSSHIQQQTGFQTVGASVQTQHHAAFPGVMDMQTPYLDPNLQFSSQDLFGFTVQDMEAEYANLQKEIEVLQNAAYPLPAQQNVGAAGSQHQQSGNVMATNSSRPAQLTWSGTVAFRPEEITVAASTLPREPRLTAEHEWAQRHGVNLADVEIDPSRTRNNVVMINDRVTLYNDATYVSAVMQEWNMPRLPSNLNGDEPNMFAAGGYQKPRAGAYGHANVQVPAEGVAGPSGTQQRKTTKRKVKVNEGAKDIDFFANLTPVKE